MLSPATLYEEEKERGKEEEENGIEKHVGPAHVTGIEGWERPPEKRGGEKQAREEGRRQREAGLSAGGNARALE